MMQKFTEIFNSLVVLTLEQTYQQIIMFAPKIILSMIVFIIGWICAVLIEKIIAKLLKALGFDILSEKTGLVKFFKKGGIKRKSSSIIGAFFYWVIIFSALIMVFNTLHLDDASQLIEQVVLYIPRIISAIILVAVGIFLGRFIAVFVQTSTQMANVPFSVALAQSSKYIVIGISVMMSLEHLGVAKTIVIEAFIIIFGVIPFILCMLFFIGGREIIRNMLAGRVLSRIYRKGDNIQFGSVEGVVQSIEFIMTRIKTDKGEMFIPNSELSNEIVLKKR
ncbi:MAG: mechanosensitive ion channel domain-containing protein [bacterium]